MNMKFTREQLQLAVDVVTYLRTHEVRIHWSARPMDIELVKPCEISLITLQHALEGNQTLPEYRVKELIWWMGPRLVRLGFLTPPVIARKDRDQTWAERGRARVFVVHGSASFYYPVKQVLKALKYFANAHGLRR